MVDGSSGRRPYAPSQTLRWLVGSHGSSASVDSRTATAGLLLAAALVGAAWLAPLASTSATGRPAVLLAGGVATAVVLGAAEGVASGRPIGLGGGLLSGSLLVVGPAYAGLTDAGDGVVLLCGLLLLSLLLRERSIYLPDGR